MLVGLSVNKFQHLAKDSLIFGAVHLLRDTILASSEPPPTPLSYCVIVWHKMHYEINLYSYFINRIFFKHNFKRLEENFNYLEW